MPKLTNLKKKREGRKPPPSGSIKTMEELDAEGDVVIDEDDDEVHSEYPVLDHVKKKFFCKPFSLQVANLKNANARVQIYLELF